MKCEACYREIPLCSGNLTAIRSRHTEEQDTWHYWCDACLDANGYVEYWIELGDFLSDPIDWLAQLSAKTWFDAKDFCQLFYRLREHGALEELRKKRS